MPWECHKIKGNEAKTELLVLLHDGPSRLIASFIQNKEAPGSLENRAISCFFGLEAGKSESSFPSKAHMRKAVQRGAEEVWNHGLYVHNDIPVDSVLRVGTRGGRLLGTLVNESGKYHLFYSLLKPLDEVLCPQHRNSSHAVPDVEFVNFKDIIHREPLCGRGSSTKASVTSAERELMAYKGISFFEFLAYGTEAFRHYLDACYREIRMINCVIPPHPHIISPTKVFVTPVSALDRMTIGPICGTLYPYYKDGSLASLIDRSIKEEARISLYRKAKWCYQLSSAIFHVHFEARSFHQDIKPPNILLDENDNLVIIDWEQCGANSFILAPEADGSFDVISASEDTNGDCCLVYTRYEGPKRVNNPIGTPEWNVFPTWKDECPKAVELAEVYSLGSTMWLLLEQVGLSHMEDVEDYSSEVVHWTSKSTDIQQSWKDVIAACVKQDPNQRIHMRELLDFWRVEFEKLRST